MDEFILKQDPTECSYRHLAKVNPKECATYFFQLANALQEIMMIFCGAFPNQP